MPVPLRTTFQKAEAKYNVTTDFPSLGLHSAAATGNVGLAEYALDHGQPINSVLDGVLPLHAACAGGNVHLVKLLIDHGADVNAPRLPRRYSNDKNRDSSIPIVGTSGSTPLHFAAANGNTEAVTLLLLHGAHAKRPDKHGITPEMLARQNGWLECADVLKQWLVNKDRDLRERPGGGIDEAKPFSSDGAANHDRSTLDNEAPLSFAGRRRIHVKQSIDTALNLLKPSSTDPKPSILAQNSIPSTPPASPSKVGEGEYTFYPVAPSDSSNPVDGSLRRPSLPHICHPSTGACPSFKTSVPTQSSASTDRGFDNQEQDPSQTSPSSGRIRKLGSKYSLMNIFKKGQTAEPGQCLDAFQSSTIMTSPASGSSLVLSGSPNIPSPLANVSAEATSAMTAPTSQTGLRAWGGGGALTHVSSQQSLCQKEPTARSASPRNPIPSALDLHNAGTKERQNGHQHHRSRDRSRSASSGKFTPEEVLKPSTSPGSSPLARLGIIRGHDHRRDRSGSAASSRLGSSPHRGGVVFDEDLSIVPGERARSHSRNSSTGQVPAMPSSFRALRFDPSPSANDVGRGDSVLAQGLRMSNSVGSLANGAGGPRLGLPDCGSSEADAIPDSAPAAMSHYEGRSGGRGERPAGDAGDDGDEHEYGQPLIHGDSSSIIDPRSLDLKPPRITLLMRDRGLSFTSSSDSSLSPILSIDHVDHAEFPFSINAPPPPYPDENEMATSNQELLRVPPTADSGRGRGNSVSSVSSSDSRNDPPLSASGTTSGSGGSDTVNTPWFQSPGRDAFLQMSFDSSPRTDPEGLIVEDIKHQGSPQFKCNSLNDTTTISPERQHPIPSDTNLISISSHAQAEALVQKAQQEILGMGTAELSSAIASIGRSPLSARLAAYGESLALERKFREQQQADQGGLPRGDLSPEISVPLAAGHNHAGDNTRRNGVERQHSLEHRNRPRFKIRVPTRPSTAEGVSPRLEAQPFTSEHPFKFHQSSRSASAASPPPRLFIDQNNTSALRDLDSGVGDPFLSSIQHRTGLLDAGEERLMGSSENLDTKADSCPSIYRATTAPVGPVRGSKTTAVKLTKMGFPTLDQARLPPPQPPKRFGAIRSLVQTLKGKP